jgi:hypothetical protein
MTLVFTFEGKQPYFEHGVKNLRMDGWTVWELTSGQVILQRFVHDSTERDHYTSTGRGFAIQAFQCRRRLTLSYERMAGQVTLSANLKLANQPDKPIIRNLLVFNITGPFNAASIEAQPPLGEPLRCDQVSRPNFTLDLTRVATRYWKNGTCSYKAKRPRSEIEQFRQTSSH